LSDLSSAFNGLNEHISAKKPVTGHVTGNDAERKNVGGPPMIGG
jgi:hypothetical protein